MMNYLKATTLVFAIFISGCQTQQQWVDRQVGADKPPEFKQGYIDGCTSGEKAAGHVYARYQKNLDLYSSSDLYKQGWDDAFEICKVRWQSIVNR